MKENEQLNDAVKELLGTLELGRMQSHANMAIFPLLNHRAGSTRYINLADALSRGTLTVTEVDEGGSVPELAVFNKGDLPVLLLDGEELIGAKQNRVLNSTILVKKQSKTVIPVSCTEQGRWSYASAEFKDSDVIMHRSARASKSRSVSYCLADQGEFASNQGAVWESIEQLQEAAGAPSPTGAMRDVFSQREGVLQAYLDAFPATENQRGLLVVVNGAAVGLDYISAESAYSQLHTKLVRSYSMDAMVMSKTSKLASKADGDEAILKAAKTLIVQARGVSEHRHKSVGHGWDHRFMGDRLVGSSLQYRNQVIHAAFFVDEGDALGGTTRMAGASRRRHYRRQGE